MKRGAVIFIFAALSLFFLGATAVWLRLDRTSPTWDDAFYLTNSLLLFDALTEGGILHYAHEFLTIMDTKPPLLVALPTPFYLVAGRHLRAAYAVNLLFLLVLFVAVFRLARKFAGERAGLLAVYLAATTPMLYGLSRWFLAECALTALVAAAVCMLWESDHLCTDSARDAPGAAKSVGQVSARPASGCPRTRHCGLKHTWKVATFGCLSGLGLLLKFSFPLYVLPPLIYEAMTARRGVRRMKTLLGLMLPVIVLALPWYFLHFRSALRTAIETGSPETMSQFFGGLDVHSLPVIRTYLARLLNAGPPLYFGALPVLLILVFKRVPPAARMGLRLCALWGMPILFLLIWPSREVRYAAPLFPAVAVALAILIESALRGGKWRLGLVGVLLALPLVNMLQVSFGLLGKWRFELGGVLFNPDRLAYAKMYDRRAWPYPEILRDVHRAAKLGGRTEETLLVATDSSHFNADTFKLAAVEQRLPFRVMTTAYEKDWHTVPPLLDWAAFFVYEEGGEPTSVYFNLHGSAAVKEVRESGNFEELPLVWPLPDGGVAHVFQNVFPNGFVMNGAFRPAGMEGIPKTKVAFAGLLELDGLSFEQKDHTLEVGYSWRCLRPVGREYWCFTHILDEEGNIVGYLDHKILNGSPPMTAWKEGDVAVETLRFRSAAIQKGRTYQLRLGLYNRVSGARLSISESALPLTDGQTAVIVSEQR